MRRNDTGGWHRTSPFASLFYIGKIYQAIAKNAVQSLAPLAAFLVAFQGDKKDALTIGIGVFVVGTLVLAILRYWFFRYRITADSILIRDGIFRKTQLDLRFERVQAVNTRQNVVFRWLGLTTVSFDTAGSSGQEGYLPAFSAESARELRDRIRRVPPQVRDEETGERAQERPGAARTLTRLTAGDMVRIGLSSNRIFLVLVLIGPIGEYVERKFGDTVEEIAVVEFLTQAQAGLMTGLVFGLLLVLGILALLFSVSIAGAFLRFHGYELVAEEDVLRSAGGLLTRHEHTVNRSKVQSLHASQHVVLRLFRRFRLRARQASSGGAVRRSDFIIPICTGDLLRDLGEEFYPREFAGLSLNPKAPGFQRISAYYLRSRIVLFGVVPAMLATATYWNAAGPAAMVALLWVPACAILAWQRYRRYGVMYGRDGLALRSGLIGSHVVGWLHRKVQRVSITQSPFQRRRRLATVRIFLAAGSAIRIPYLEQETAQALRDYVLYRVESSEAAWH